MAAIESPVTLERRTLDGEHDVQVGALPESLHLSAQEFAELWDLHPPERPWIHLHGRRVQIPRWQQAYGRDYDFSGQTSRALPVPALLEPLLGWTREHIDARLNGILLNWYDGALGHYIGPHRDDTRNLVPECPIVTVSLGEERKLRFRPHGGKGLIDVAAPDHSVVLIPFETNAAWTHEVPKTKKARGRRISATIRAFA